MVDFPIPHYRKNKMVIYKYPLIVTDIQIVLLPEGAQILHVDVQNHCLCLWALVDPEAPLYPQTIEVIGTGNTILTIGTIKHIGTVLMAPFVWHIFTR